MVRDPALEPLNGGRRQPAVAGLKLPAIRNASDTLFELMLQQRLRPPGQPLHALGRLEALAVQLAGIQNTRERPFDALVLDAPQLVVFAGDHGLADEGMDDQPQSMTSEHVLQLLDGRAPVSVLARRQGFGVTVVDAGLSQPIAVSAGPGQHAALQKRKIGFGTRNCNLGPAMSLVQAVSALHAGMDVVRHLPGNVLALGDIGVGNQASAALLLSRLCGIPLSDALPHDGATSESEHNALHVRRVEKLMAVAQRHPQSTAPIHALATFGGFEIAMLVGAMLQGASERRVVLVDGFAAGVAALVARALQPNVSDYLVFAHRAAHAPHRLLFIHLQAQPLLDLNLRVNQGTGALLAWPLLLSAQAVLESTA